MIKKLCLNKIKNPEDYNLDALIELQNIWTKGDNDKKRLSSDYTLLGNKYIHFKYANQSKFINKKRLGFPKNAEITNISDILEIDKRLDVIIITKENYISEQMNILYHLEISLNLNFLKIEQMNAICFRKGKIKIEKRLDGFIVYSKELSKFYKF